MSILIDFFWNNCGKSCLFRVQKVDINFKTTVLVPKLRPKITQTQNNLTSNQHVI